MTVLQIVNTEGYAYFEGKPNTRKRHVIKVTFVTDMVQGAFHSTDDMMRQIAHNRYVDTVELIEETNDDTIFFKDEPMAEWDRIDEQEAIVRQHENLYSYFQKRNEERIKLFNPDDMKPHPALANGRRIKIGPLSIIDGVGPYCGPGTFEVFKDGDEEPMQNMTVEEINEILKG